MQLVDTRVTKSRQFARWTWIPRDKHTAPVHGALSALRVWKHLRHQWFRRSTRATGAKLKSANRWRLTTFVGVR